MAKGFIKGALWGSCVSLTGVVILSVVSSNGAPDRPAVVGNTVAPAATVTDAGQNAPEKAEFTSAGSGSGLPAAGTPDTLAGLQDSDVTPAAVPSAGAASALAQPAAGIAAGTAPSAPQTDVPVPGGTSAGLSAPVAEPAVTLSTQSADLPAKTGSAAGTASDAPSVQTEVAALAAPALTVVPGSAPEPEEGSISNLPVQPPEPAVPSETGAFTEAAPETVVAADPVQPAAPAVVASATGFEAGTRPASDADAPAQRDAGEIAPAVKPADTEEASTGFDLPATVPDVQQSVVSAPETALAAADTDTVAPEPETPPAVRADVTQPAAVSEQDATADIADTTTPAPQAGAPIVIAQNDTPAAATDQTGTVRTNRLPSIGDTVPADEEATAEDVVAEQEEAAPDAPPLQRYASDVENPEGKPVMAIVLMDSGVDLDGAGIGLPALRSFPHPVTFAIDASLPDAAERAAAYRAEGFEVLAMVDLPAGARATDAEVTVTAALEAVPEAVGVLEGVGAGVATTPDAGQQVAAILADTGHGFIAQNKGLNTVHKQALRAGVPAALVFRDFDSAGQTPVVIRRFLDQAAFRAGQEDGVIMLGRLREDTISALLLWALQDRAERVAMVPVSGALTAPGE